MIKNIEKLKKIQIVCRNTKQVKDCLNYLKQLGFYIDYHDNENYLIVFYDTLLDGFMTSYELEKKYVEFYNKELVKILQKFIKEKEEKQEKKEEVKDFEVVSDGRIIKINNKESEKKIFTCYSREGDRIRDLYPDWLDYVVEQGLAYATQEAKECVIFKSKIETKLKNIAERLNKGQKIDWEDKDQSKFRIHYNFYDKNLESYECYYYKTQGTIYCLDKHFFDVAKKEIGEQDLIKYFTE